MFLLPSGTLLTFKGAHCVFVLIPALSSIAGILYTGYICVNPEVDKVHMCICVRVNPDLTVDSPVIND